MACREEAPIREHPCDRTAAVPGEVLEGAEADDTVVTGLGPVILPTLEPDLGAGAEDVLSVLAARPGRQHVVITGRDADPRLLEAADLVTEMTKVKHPMDAGQKGQKGIEW